MYDFTGQLRAHDKEIDEEIPKGAWYFVAVPTRITESLREEYGLLQGSFGTLPVQVKSADQRWETSLFYDTKASTYLLPVKSVIRKALGVEH